MYLDVSKCIIVFLLLKAISAWQIEVRFIISLLFLSSLLQLHFPGRFVYLVLEYKNQIEFFFFFFIDNTKILYITSVVTAVIAKKLKDRTVGVKACLVVKTFKLPTRQTYLAGAAP